jgi:outer membrane protein
MELVKPIQDKVYNAVKAVADRGGFAIIFDKSGSLTMLYTNPRYDKSDDVLNYMGYNKKK